MADLRARVVPPIGSVRGPLCALRHMRARLDVGNGARWPGFAIVAVLRRMCAQMLLFFLRSKCAQAVLRASASVGCVRCVAAACGPQARTNARGGHWHHPRAGSSARAPRSTSCKCLPLLLGCFSHHVGSLRGCRRDGRCCRCAAPHQYVSELGFICPGQACAAVQAAPSLRIRLASAATHGSEARDANKTRPCSFKQAEVAYWYVPAVSAQLGIKPCAFGW